MLFEIAHQIGIIPLLVLALLGLFGVPRDWRWWSLATAFAVSWIADSIAHVASPWLVSAVYPVSQAGIAGLVLLDRRDVRQFTIVLCGVGITAILWHGIQGPDVLLRTVAWAPIAVIALRPSLRLPAMLRISIVLGFGGALLAWWAYTAAPGWPTWLVYQGTRLLAALLFAAAAVDHSRPRPA